MSGLAFLLVGALVVAWLTNVVVYAVRLIVGPYNQ